MARSNTSGVLWLRRRKSCRYVVYPLYTGMKSG